MPDLNRVVQFSAPFQVDVTSVPTEPLLPGHVRVRTRYSGISAGTELTAYRGTNPYLTRAWDADRRLFTDGGGAQPRYPVAGWGYSEVGEVVEVAPDVALVGPDHPDGAPAPGQLVWGIWGHRDEAVLPADRLRGHALPRGLDPLAASFARVGAVALGAVLAADVHLGETVAIFGQGVIGLLATRLAVLSGARVASVDALEPRLAAARAFGATATLDAAGPVAEELRRLTGGRGADAAIELSGSYRALHEAVRAVAVAGRVVAAGFYQGEGVGLRLGEEFHHNRVQLVAAQIGGVPLSVTGRWDQARLNATFLDLAVTGAVDPVGLVSHVLPADRAAEAYDLLDRRPAEALQVVLEF
jgi:2-desacetyl-2-hydroxyethyl bacteriochlorophyllide A dehydrogenase